MKQYIDYLTKTISSNATTIEEMTKDFNSLKQLYGQIKREQESLHSQTITDCIGLPGYEKDIEGDGLTGHYYNNLSWKGEPKTRVDKEIRFYWSNEEPFPGVDSNDYTIEWKGFIRAPRSGNYIFECESDDGCIVEINNSIVIRDSLPEVPSSDLIQSQRDVMEEYIQKAEWTEFIRPRTMDEPERFPRNKQSDDVFLTAGS